MPKNIARLPFNVIFGFLLPETRNLFREATSSETAGRWGDDCSLAVPVVLTVLHPLHLPIMTVSITLRQLKSEDNYYQWTYNVKHFLRFLRITFQRKILDQACRAFLKALSKAYNLVHFVFR